MDQLLLSFRRISFISLVSFFSPFFLFSRNLASEVSMIVVSVSRFLGPVSRMWASVSKFFCFLALVSIYFYIFLFSQCFLKFYHFAFSFFFPLQVDLGPVGVSFLNRCRWRMHLHYNCLKLCWKIPNQTFNLSGGLIQRKHSSVSHFPFKYWFLIFFKIDLVTQMVGFDRFWIWNSVGFNHLWLIKVHLAHHFR